MSKSWPFDNLKVGESIVIPWQGLEFFSESVRNRKYSMIRNTVRRIERSSEKIFKCELTKYSGDDDAASGVIVRRTS